MVYVAGHFDGTYSIWGFANRLLVTKKNKKILLEHLEPKSRIGVKQKIDNEALQLSTSSSNRLVYFVISCIFLTKPPGLTS